VTRTQLTVLWGLAVGVVLVFVVLTYVLSRSLPLTLPSAARQASVPVDAMPSAEVYRLPETPYSARSLYNQAERVAQAWQPDAGLVSAVASWPFAELDGLSGPVDWTFSFFSPGTQRVYVVNANQEQVTPIRETLSPYLLPMVALDRWRVDSYQALSAWLNGGGGDFLRGYPIVDISVRLAVDEGQVLWAVVGTDRGNQSAFAVRLDAAGGSVLE
jgi:hypothetical protein